MSKVVDNSIQQAFIECPLYVLSRRKEWVLIWVAFELVLNPEDLDSNFSRWRSGWYSIINYHLFHKEKET